MPTLTALLAIAEAATPGRRKWDPHDCSFGVLQDEGSHYVTLAFADADQCINISDADARHIAAFDRETCVALVRVAMAAREWQASLDKHPYGSRGDDDLESALAALTALAGEKP